MNTLQPVDERSEPLTVPPRSQPRRSRWLWVFDLLFLLVLVVGAYFRTIGINWDENQHLHPDERFLTLVEAAIRPVQSAAEYFHTQDSSLNPHNVGYTYFVYGTLPIFIVRYVGEWVGQTGYNEIHLVGRQLSAIADLLTVMLVYLIASRLYDRRVGLFASIFSALAVLQIQLSHYWTVDTFTNFFTFAAFYFAIRVMLPDAGGDPGVRTGKPWWEAASGQTIHYILFGLALGMAVASKVSAAPLAMLLPAAAVIRLSRLDRETLNRAWLPVLVNLTVAGAVSLLVFRICQPYAFSGPGFFNFTPNPLWVQNLRELSAQSTGDVDAPFALQWARRPIWFAWENMVKWGLGIPLGLAAWLGFFWMGWRILKGEWRSHLLVWVWTLVYFSWQSINWVRSMRYQLLVYPTLAIIAAWAIIRLWDYRRKREGTASSTSFPWIKLAAGGIAVVVVLGTFGWAYAFTRIYTRPVTRVAASEWIYDNVPGPINLHIETGEETVPYPLPYRAGAVLQAGVPLRFSFVAVADGYLTSVSLENLYDQLRISEEKTVTLRITEATQPGETLASVDLRDPFNPPHNPGAGAQSFLLPSPVQVREGERYELTLETAGVDTFLALLGPVTLNLEPVSSTTPIPQVLPLPVQRITTSSPYLAEYRVATPGIVRQISIPHLVDLAGLPGEKSVRLTFSGPFDQEQQVGTATITGDFSGLNDPRGGAYTFILDEPVIVETKGSYLLTIALAGGEGDLAVYGSWPAIESSWDDAIPVPLQSFSPWGETSFIYRGDLNLQMYWNDNPDKLDRFLSILQQADYIFITSNRQWGTIPRVPERYPLSRLYYRELIGCPPQEDLLRCYSTAEPGSYRGRLGFELVQVFQSDPTIGPWRINDQFAEEAFTVYDHPKVLIFQKTDRFDLADVASTLSTADLEHVMVLTPGRATKASNNLMLPSHVWAKQQAGGTYSILFDPQALLNRYPGISVVVWYLVVAALGWVVYPLVRLALPGLSDRGYPLARVTGLVLLAYLVWVGGSLGLAVTPRMITWAVLLLVLVGAVLAYLQQRELLHELRVRRGFFLTVEGIALLFFALDLLIRLGNPDLWHPNYGGERPMNFSYFNAILKSTTFPPYDPWYAGGYINYYYYGYVVVGVLVKWLGIIPSVAFNLILPTLFSLLVLGAFSLGWNLYSGRKAIFPEAPPQEVEEDDDGTGGQAAPAEAEKPFSFLGKPVFAIGLAASVGFALLGNLGTLRMIWYGFQRLAVPAEATQGANFFARMAWTVEGFIAYLQGAKLPYATANWYWIPSRAIPTPGETEPITEFPFFTILYSDLHAHLIALPITLLVLGWIISVFLRRGRWGDENGRLNHLGGVLGFLLGGLAIGALRPTNTWDFYTYLLLGGLALLYANLRAATTGKRQLTSIPDPGGKIILGGASMAILVALAFLLYQPFSEWYRQGYNSVDIWKGLRTPFWSYLTHWGLFLFVIVSWMVWETRDWLSTTPMSALKRLYPYRSLIQAGILVTFGFLVVLTLAKVMIGWVVVLVGLWAAALMVRPGMPDAKRLALFLVGSGLFLTLFVELFVLRGDIGRMNTVFKFYLQVWTFLAIAAAASLGWLLDRLDGWSPRWFPIWSVVFTGLVISAALFPLLGGMAKIRDRMAPNVPITLDSMTYMNYARYTDVWGEMDLSKDYRAIHWLQENVPGSPVIVEANLRALYRWGSRMTIYTGLPGVVGWEWHQQQQRVAVPPGWITDRIVEIEAFYRTTDEQEARAFLEKYNVGYIIVGQQERGMYPGPGLEKFELYDGILWDEVYRDGETVIYQSACECSVF